MGSESQMELETITFITPVDHCYRETRGELGQILQGSFVATCTCKTLGCRLKIKLRQIKEVVKHLMQSPDKNPAGESRRQPNDNTDSG